jgi:DNA mismatch repair protein MutS2
MLFDTEKIQPVFKLAMGRPGSSFAFEIARNIGIPEDILETARERAGKDHIEFDRHLRDIIRDRKYWENKRERIRIAEKNLNKLVEKYDRELSDTDKLKKSILREAKQKADEILDGANKQIENTIREIREAEAEKQRTREARQKLEEFREEVQKIAEEKDQLQLKLDELKKREDLRRKKQNEKPARIAHPEEISDPRIREGDFVMLEGQDMPGQVLRAGKKNSLVVFGNIHTHVRTDKLEKINRQKFEESKGTEYTHSDPGTWDLMNRRLNFSADIDLRGKRAEEALRILTEFIDEAIMVQRRDLRILHGKGNGILRELIRQQLKINKIVEWFGDEHVDRGGAGITLVRLDV